MAGALAAVNCVGDVTDGGRIIAGTLDDTGAFADSQKLILNDYSQGRDFFSGARLDGAADGNTVLGCIITNACFDKAGAARLAGQGQNAVARLIRPGHSVFDGDTVFTLSTGRIKAAADAAGILACAAMEAAILDAVKSAISFGGYTAWIDRQRL
jgi:L-aminopeptidase/D-esterase-like protein